MDIEFRMLYRDTGTGMFVVQIGAKHGDRTVKVGKMTLSADELKAFREQIRDTGISMEGVIEDD